MGIPVDRRWAAFTVWAIAGVFLVSSIPELTTSGGPAFRALCNLLHAPVYAALTLLWLGTFKARAPLSGRMFVLVFAVSTACALFDEVHQAFVPGRVASAGDLFTDLIGIGAVLTLKRLPAATVSR